jgi:glycosyltransferase A (GT-A) superfamily protein (DUF2064 family)
VTRPPAARPEPARPPAALILADPPTPGDCLPGLEPLLGPEGCARLQAVLVRRAAAWAAEVAPGRALVAVAPPPAGTLGAPPPTADHPTAGSLGAESGDVAALVPEGTVVFGQSGAHRGERLIAAVEQAFASAGPGPLLVAGTGVPRLSAAHAAAALADLAEGCDATFGPALDGGFYLAGLAGSYAAVFTLPAEAWEGADLLTGVLSCARENGLELGLLRYERELRAPLDVRALLADPLAPADVVAVLRDAE